MLASLAALTLLLATPPAASSAPARQERPMLALSDRELVLRVRALPDLITLARQALGDGADWHPEQRRRAAELTARRTPFVATEPYRCPPEPCSAGTHQVPCWKRRIVDPRTGAPRTLELWEHELHETELHRAGLRPEARAFLVALFDAG